MIIRQSRTHYRIPMDEKSFLRMQRLIKETGTKTAQVETLGGQNFLLLPIKYFSSESIVEKFVDANLGKKIHKECDGVATKAAEITDAELAQINKFAVKKLTKEEVTIYTMKVANNKIDRDQERFADEVLDSFAKSVVGKSWLYMHNKRDFMPFGKLFDAWTAVENGMKWLYVKGYLLSSDAETVAKIDSGIWKFVSIGFTAPELMVIIDNTNGKVTHYEYRNMAGKEAEALEVSLVWLGAQYDAEVSKSFNIAGDKALDVLKQATMILTPEKISQCKTLDEVQLAVEQEQSARDKQHARNNADRSKNHSQRQGVRSMKHILKIFGVDSTVETGENATEEQLIEAGANAVEAKATEKITTLQNEVTALKADAEKNSAAIVAFKENLVNEVATLINEVVKFTDDTERAAEVTRLKALDIPALQKEQESWKIKSDKRKAGSGSVKPQTQADNQDGEKSMPVSAASFQTVVD